MTSSGPFKIPILALMAVLLLQNASAQLPEIQRMRRVAVQSGAIRSIGYHRKTKTLEVRFHSGVTYRYAKVPPTVHEEFLEAESKGHYFREHIYRRYPYWKVEPQ